MQGWDVKPWPVLAAFNLLQKTNTHRCELPWTRCQPCVATGQSKCNPSLRKTPRFQLSPSLTQHIKPQEFKHFSQNSKIFHFEKLEIAKLKLQRGCTPNTWSLRHIFHHENLNKVDTFPQSFSAPSKPAPPSRKKIHRQKVCCPAEENQRYRAAGTEQDENRAAVQQTPAGKSPLSPRHPAHPLLPPDPSMPGEDRAGSFGP